MPEQHPRPTRTIFSLSNAHAQGLLIRVRCALCRTTRHYFPDDLRRLLGDIDCNIVERQMRCEDCGKREYMDAKGVSLTGMEKDGLRVRRLVAIKIRQVPVWKDVPA